MFGSEHRQRVVATAKANVETIESRETAINRANWDYSAFGKRCTRARAGFSRKDAACGFIGTASDGRYNAKCIQEKILCQLATAERITSW